MKILPSVLFVCLASSAFCQQGTAILTPTIDLKLQRTKIEVPSKFAKLVDTSKFYVNLPRGYKARVFYIGGLAKPRFMDFNAQGVLHVSVMDNGNIVALPDKNGDGVADSAFVAASGFSKNHDVKFYKGNMYVSEPTKVTKLIDNNKDGIFETKTSFISGIPGGGNHITRTMIFDSINKKFYLSIGSSCNVCRETTRAIIEQYNDDGTGKRTIAYGARNAVGMGLHPVTNRLWANNNGSDWIETRSI
jgi:glucose/arabinose dehydrogenase